MPRETSVTGQDGTKSKKTVRAVEVVEKIKDLENYGEIWYYTKLNADNAYFDHTGLMTAPDAGGNWPLRTTGWGHGLTWNPLRRKQGPWWGWHRYGAWVGLVSAVEGGVRAAEEAWDVMRSLAAKKSIYGYEMVPRFTYERK